MKTSENQDPIRHQGGIIRPRGKRFLAEYNVGNARSRKSYRTIEQAKAWIEERDKQLLQKGIAGLRLTSRDTEDAIDALELSKGRASLKEAMTFWLKHHHKLEDSLTVRQTYERHLARMVERNLRPQSIRSRTGRLKPLVAEFGETKLMELSRSDVEGFVTRQSQGARKPLSLRSILNLKSELQAFFNWAEKDGGANSGFVNNLMHLDVPVRDAKTNEIIHAKNAEKVLHQLERTHPESAIALAISCFAGLRSEELNQILWEDVDFDDNEIRVRAEICKTRTSREVPIEPNLLKWLKKYRKASGLISPRFTIRDKHKMRACEKLEIHWPKNAARHSYGTFHARHYGSPSQAADNMGHVGGIKMFASAYKGFCTKAEAAAYWKIEPLVGKKTAATKAKEPHTT